MCASSLLQRLLLVSGDLSVLASIDASCGSVGLSHGITSLLWVGPALLYMTAAGQVRGGLQYIEVQSSHSAIQNCTDYCAVVQHRCWGQVSTQALASKPRALPGANRANSGMEGTVQQ